MKTCETCEHFHSDGCCYRYPPKIVVVREPGHHNFWESFRPSVNKDDKACGEWQQGVCGKPELDDEPI